MAGFSTNAETAINRNVIIDDQNNCPCKNDELIHNYNLSACVEWIKKHNYSKICLQFPDALLVDSVAISLWLENQIAHKVFILGDTSYGSCCVDEIAAEHINSDAIIHFGHACLSPTTRLPILYIYPKLQFCVPLFISELKQHCLEHTEQVLLLYDVEYEHCIDEIKGKLEDMKERVIISELCSSQEHTKPCCLNCCLINGRTQHQIVKLGRAYCSLEPKTNIVYIGKKDSRTLENFVMSLKGVNVYAYYGQSLLPPVNATRSIRRRLYLSERVKDAKTIGILIATLGITHYLKAVESIRKLATRRGKKCYIISVGKPSVAKLANFPEVEVFVLVSCPEAVLEDEREYMQPVVTLMEAELALNEARQWDEIVSTDFRDLLPGGDNYIPLPEKFDVNESDVSLVTNRIRSIVNESESTTDGNLDLVLRPDLPVSVGGQSLANRSWQGLEQALGQTPVTKATLGRSGIPQSYAEETLPKSADSSNKITKYCNDND